MLTNVMTNYFPLIKCASNDMSKYNRWKLLQATLNFKCDCEVYFFALQYLSAVEDPFTDASYKQRLTLTLTLTHTNRTHCYLVHQHLS